MYYDPARTLSHNCMLNFVLSNRGGGKTFSMLNYITKKYQADGSQFIWIRRTQTELDLIKKNMFKALEHEGFTEPGQFSVAKDIITTGADNELTAGGIYALSKAFQFKSIAWPEVKYIVFDEFIDERRRYLKNEVNLLLSVIESVARMRNVKVILLANSITKYNPYFDFFNLDHDPDKEFQKDKKRSILIHNWRSQEYTKAKKETVFAKMLEGTEYGAFMFENENILDNDDFIKKVKVKTKEPIMSFIFENQGFCCWYVETKTENMLYITLNENKNSARKVNFDEEMKENYHWLSRRSTFVKNLRKTAERGAIYFESGRVKLAISALLNAVR